MERIDIILEYLQKKFGSEPNDAIGWMLQEVVIKLNVTIGVLVHYVNHWDH